MVGGLTVKRIKNQLGIGHGANKLLPQKRTCYEML